MDSDEKDRKDRAARLVIARETCDNRFVRDNATEAARLMGILPPTYLGHENGSRGFDNKSAKKYANFYQVEVLWLLYGMGPVRARRA